GALVASSADPVAPARAGAASPATSATTAAAPAAPVPQGAAAPASAPPDGHVVRRGETLGRFAQQYKPADVTLEQMHVAMFNANAGAFDG
ncbi:MAG: hypothetical protein KJ018_13585, partial [Burkholderiales bacterium]|nr:hypothetical protein [Burkholderiales bacterium]